jgi:phosphatidylinositol alpha-1,6-mannosyltransferase
VTHLLVTNDFPPKVGGIQSYLYELWSRLDPASFVVLTHAAEGASSFDASQNFRIVRVPGKMLLPTAALRRHINRVANDAGASLVVLDPALPLGLIGASLDLPYALVLHGAEITVPGRLAGLRGLLRKSIEGASLLVAAGAYPLGEAQRVARRLPPTVVVPPGVDTSRFRPLSDEEKAATRERFGIPSATQLVVSVSRLVPRKGMDVLIEAAAKLARDRPDLLVAIGGTGRDRERLERLVETTGAPARLLGYVPDDELPFLIGAADVSVMLCRDRWLGLEQEGFGIVFLEAAAAGVACVAGRSGGAGDAVVDNETGLIVDRPADVVPATSAIERLLDDKALRASLGEAGRERALEEFDYARLAGKLRAALDLQGA